MVLVGDGQLRNSNRNPPHHWKSLANKHKPVIFENVRILSRFFRLSFSFFKVCVLIWFVEIFIFFLINILNNISMRMFTKMFSSRFFKIYMYVSSHISLTQMLMKGEIIMFFAETYNAEVSGCSCTVLYAFAYVIEKHAYQFKITKLNEVIHNSDFNFAKTKCQEFHKSKQSNCVRFVRIISS